MKRLCSHQVTAGFTRTELLKVLAIVAGLAFGVVVVLAHAVKDVMRKEYLWNCAEWNRDIGVGYRTWAASHRGLFPAQASVADGGWHDLLTNRNAGEYCWTNFAILKDELNGLSQLLICPADTRRPPTNFIVKGSTNDLGNAAIKDNFCVSYFVGVGAASNYPSSILGGDRTLGPGEVAVADYGWSPSSGMGNDVAIYTNSVVSWSQKMHSDAKHGGAGILLLADGSAQQTTSTDLRSHWLRDGGLGVRI